MRNKEIPLQALPDTQNISFALQDEPFVEIRSYSQGKIQADMQYYKANRTGAIAEAYMRKTVADKLLKALTLLPEGYALKIYDAWRPYAVQKSLYDEYYDTLKKENPSLDEAQLHERAKTFVSFPDKSKTVSYVHSSGGAIDLTLVDKTGRETDMGCGFDDFTPLAATVSLEGSLKNQTAKENRRLLYYAMTAAGFTNYPAEWWHYDYGDIFWSAATGKPVLYGSVYEKPNLR